MADRCSGNALIYGNVLPVPSKNQSCPPKWTRLIFGVIGRVSIFGQKRSPAQPSSAWLPPFRSWEDVGIIKIPRKDLQFVGFYRLKIAGLVILWVKVVPYVRTRVYIMLIHNYIGLLTCTARLATHFSIVSFMLRTAAEQKTKTH